MTEADRLLGIELCKRFPVDLADAQGIIDFVRSAPKAKPRCKCDLKGHRDGACRNECRQPFDIGGTPHG